MAILNRQQRHRLGDQMRQLEECYFLYAIYPWVHPLKIKRIKGSFYIAVQPYGHIAYCDIVGMVRARPLSTVAVSSSKRVNVKGPYGSQRGFCDEILNMCCIRIARTALPIILLLAGCSHSGTKEKRGTEATVALGPVSSWEGQLIRRPGSTPEDGKVYIVKKGGKHWVTTGQWLLEHGYQWPDVKLVTSEQFAAIPTRDPIQ